MIRCFYLVGFNKNIYFKNMSIRVKVESKFGSECTIFGGKNESITVNSNCKDGIPRPLLALSLQICVTFLATPLLLDHHFVFLFSLIIPHLRHLILWFSEGKCKPPIGALGVEVRGRSCYVDSFDY